MNPNILIEIKNAIPRIDTLAFRHPINWQIKDNEHWAVIGANGAGKTLLVDIMTRKHALRSGEIMCLENESIGRIIKSVAFKDIYSLADLQNSYYQQRWNAGDERDMPHVKELFAKGAPLWVNELISAFGINDLIDKQINLLSSGELRKTLIVRTLIEKPRILVLDNPFIGLDYQSRILLDDVLNKLAQLDNLQIVVIVSDPKDIPNIVTHVLPIKDKTILPVMSRNDFMNNPEIIPTLFNFSSEQLLPHLKAQSVSNVFFENALIFRKILIRYGSRTILKDLNWTVKRGEKWALLGPNGSGKSTLLSLVAGDNPQAYANDITLFDRKRGSGESIWDIKRHIGYISPEVHLYYLKNVPCIDVVGSGFFDTIGLYKTCNTEQRRIALEWMQAFGIEHLRNASFLQISNGEQRLVLLARVFVKNPSLLILDEPLHGLDISNKEKIKRMIEDFCGEEKVLIYVTHYEEEIPEVVTERLVLTKLS